MFAAGSRAEVTAPFKHANLPRSNLLLFFLASGLLKMRRKKKGLGEPRSGSLELHLGRKWERGTMGRQRLLPRCETQGCVIADGSARNHWAQQNLRWSEGVTSLCVFFSFSTEASLTKESCEAAVLHLRTTSVLFFKWDAWREILLWRSVKCQIITKCPFGLFLQWQQSVTMTSAVTEIRQRGSHEVETCKVKSSEPAAL